MDKKALKNQFMKVINHLFDCMDCIVRADHGKIAFIQTKIDTAVDKLCDLIIQSAGESKSKSKKSKS